MSRPAGQVPLMQAKVQPHEVEQPRDDQVRTGVPTTHARDAVLTLIR